ncbi:MAG: cytochrome c biogenesis protein CcdA [Syntrophobacteria bacterium]|jgi:cytochrome c-type biogenesis protein
MTGLDLINTVWLPLWLGLFGFIEPCSIGSSLVFIKYLEGKDEVHKLAQVSVFAVVRALFMGTLGLLAVWLGMAFLGLQKGIWIVFGALYVLIGVIYLAGKSSALSVSLGPSLSRLSGLAGSVGLGVVFAFSIPACAAPLIFALLGTAAASGAGGGALASGFISLAIFGLALSLPLVLAVLFAPARRGLDWLAGLSGRLPFWTGVVLIAVGLWSIGFGLFLSLEKHL